MLSLCIYKLSLWILWNANAEAGVVLPVSGLQDTPASSECRQLCSPQALFGHCSRVSSLPVQRTSSSHTRFEPLPKCALSHALATPLQRNARVQKSRGFSSQYFGDNRKQMYWLAMIYNRSGIECCVCFIFLFRLENACISDQFGEIACHTHKHCNTTVAYTRIAHRDMCGECSVA